MVCLGFELGAAGWQVQIKPRSYGGHPPKNKSLSHRLFVSLEQTLCVKFICCEISCNKHESNLLLTLLVFSQCVHAWLKQGRPVVQCRRQNSLSRVVEIKTIKEKNSIFIKLKKEILSVGTSIVLQKKLKKWTINILFSRFHDIIRKMQ